MDPSKFSYSNIPKASNLTRRIPKLSDSSLSNSIYNSGGHYKVFNDDQTEQSKFSLTYTLDDAKKHLNQSVHYLKSNLTGNRFSFKKISFIFIVLMLLFGIGFVLYNRSEMKALNGAIKSVSQDKNLLEDKFEKLEKQFRKLSGLTSESKFIDDQGIGELRNEIEKSVTDKLDELSNELKKLVDREVNLGLNTIKLETEMNLRAELSESMDNKLELLLDNKLKNLNPTKLDESSITYSIKMAIDNLVLDKNSKLDYASELNNAYILEASPTFTDPNGYTFFSIPLFSTSKSPSYLLKRDTNLLELNPRPWKMNSNTGFVTIKLAKPIIPESFSYDHVLMSSILDENQYTCAPKVFRVIGYKDESQDEPIALGKFNFELSNENFQTEFEFDKKLKTEIAVIQFTVEDNYGNSNYTCMHRLRVF